MGTCEPWREEQIDNRRGRRSRASDGEFVAEAGKGAIAGAVGVWALDRVTGAMWDRTDPAKLRQEEALARVKWTRRT